MNLQSPIAIVPGIHTGASTYAALDPKAGPESVVANICSMDKEPEMTIAELDADADRLTGLSLEDLGCVPDPLELSDEDLRSSPESPSMLMVDRSPAGPAW